jgi:hypothetical protein
MGAAAVKVLGASGQRIRKAAHRTNPKRTRVARCVRKLKSDIARGRKRPVRSVYAVCTKATGQSYATGRRTNAAKRVGRRRNPAALPVRVSMGGAVIAQFRSLPRAKQYAQALANKARRQVRVTA